MRKLTAFVLALLLVFSSSACGNDNSVGQSLNNEKSEDTDDYKTTTELSYGEEGVFVGKILGEGILCYLQMDDTVHFTNENGKEYDYDVIRFYGKDSVAIEDGGYVGKTVVIKGTIYDYRGSSYYFESFDIIHEQGETIAPQTVESLPGWDAMTNNEKTWAAIREFIVILYRSELFDDVEAMMDEDAASYIKQFSAEDGSCVTCYPVRICIDGLWLSGTPDSLGVSFAFDVYENHFRVQIFHPYEMSPHLWEYDWNGNCIDQKNMLDESDSRTAAEFLKCCIAELS